MLIGTGDAATWVGSIGSILAVATAAWVAVWTDLRQRRRTEEERNERKGREETEANSAMKMLGDVTSQAAVVFNGTLLLLKEDDSNADVVESCRPFVAVMELVHAELAQLVSLQPRGPAQLAAMRAQICVRAGVHTARVQIDEALKDSSNESRREFALKGLGSNSRSLNFVRHELTGLIKKQEPSYEPIPPINAAALVLRDKVVVFVESDQTTLRTVLIDGETCIPVFSSKEQFDAETRGTPFGGGGGEAVAIDRAVLASKLDDTVVLVLNAGGAIQRLSKVELLVGQTI